MNLRSRKLWVTTGSMLLMFLNDRYQLGIDSETIIGMSGLGAAYVIGQSYVDGKKAEPASLAAKGIKGILSNLTKGNK